MIKRPFIRIAIVIGLGIVGAVAWYLGSPLFINTTVDEPFVFEAPRQQNPTQRSEVALQEMEAAVMAAIPSEAELAQMSGQERQALEAEVMATAAAMPDTTMDEVMLAAAESAEAQPVAVLQGEFKDADSFHQGAGTATIYQLPDGTHILRLEDFAVTNGPDLHVLLASNAAPSSSADLGTYLDLGSLKGNRGNQNYEIPAETDLAHYASIVIYCKPFHVVFATATLG